MATVYLISLLAMTVALVIVAVIGHRAVARQRSLTATTSEELAKERAARDNAEKALSENNIELARTRALLDAAQQESTRLRDDMEKRFKSIAADIMLQSTERLQRNNVQCLSDVLTPMKENLEQFKKTFAEHTQGDAAQRSAMTQRMHDLMELNATIGRETRRLTDALKGNAKMQGDWGEMILTGILEHCGLKEGREFTTQQSITNADGSRRRPDVIINYTHGRKIVVDSKVSIQAYLHMVEADNDESRKRYATEHVDSVRKHIKELRDKNYQDLVGSAHVDFILMFIPHEGAYMAAMQTDETLWETAYKANVLIVSPTHLMSVVRLVEQMWRQDRQERNAIEIAEQAGKMLDKFYNFITDMDLLDKALKDARNKWDSAFSKLSTGRGNLISYANKLTSLGVKAKKALPDRYLSADVSLPEAGSQVCIPEQNTCDDDDNTQSDVTTDDSQDFVIDNDD